MYRPESRGAEMSIEIMHNNNIVRYDESSDEWCCSTLGIKAKTLSALKKKLNEFDAIERKLGKNGVVMLHLGHYRYHSKKGDPVRATMLDKEDVDKYPCVWVTHVNSKDREKVGLCNLIPNTSENIAILEEALKLETEAKALTDKADKMRRDIKRLSVAEIKAMALDVKPE